MLLKVKPKAFMIAKVEITDAGIARALIKVVLIFLRNRSTAKIAKKPP
jgi:hypothetical protein